MRWAWKQYEAVRSGLLPRILEIVPQERLAASAAAMADFCGRYYLLPIAYAIFLAGMVLTNDQAAPRTIYFAALLPIGLLVGFAFARQALTTSVVFWAVAVYLLAMGLASLTDTEVPLHDVGRHLRLVPLILSYLIVVAVFATDARLQKWLLLISCVLVAASALFNTTQFIVHSGRLCPDTLSAVRLCAVLGMPEYNNSTNISAPYALYAVAGIALVAHGGLTRLEQALLVVSAAIMAYALVLTDARSGLLALALGCVVLAATGPRWFRFVLAALAVAVVAALAASSTLRNLLLLRGMSYRPELWAAYFSMGLEQPLFGHGIIGNIDQRMHDGHIVDQPHNLILSAFVRAGTVGALAMATAIFGAIYWAAKYYARTGHAIPLALIATMFGYGMFDYQLLATYPNWPWITFWFPLGICVGIETMMRAQSARSGNEGTA